MSQATSADVKVIERRLSPIVQKADDLVIKDEKGMAKATELLSQVNKYGDAAKAEKEKTLRPAMDTVAAIRAQWKPIETVVTDAVALIRRKMTDYQTAAKAKEREAQAKIAERAAKGQLKVETAVRKMGEVDAPAASVSTDSGMVKFKTVQKFEVVNIRELINAVAGGVNDKYLSANEVEIRKAMLAGIQLPGVRYYTEEVPVNFR